MWSSLTAGPLSTTAYVRYEVQMVAPGSPPVLSFVNTRSFGDSDIAEHSLVLIDDVRVVMA
jgi:hypothetical protein